MSFSVFYFIQCTDVLMVRLSCTSIDEGWAVVEGAKMWPRQWKEGMKSVKIALKPGPRQHGAHYQISQRMTHKAGKQSQLIW